MIRPVITDFSAGELSPRLAGRVDLPIYYRGARELLNMIPWVLGGVHKRPGTRFIGQLLNHGRLIPFVVSPSLVFILELSAGHLRLWANEALVIGTSGSTIDISTSYTDSELFEVDYTQTYREITLFHENHAPFRLRYLSQDISGQVSLEYGTPSYAYNSLEFSRMEASSEDDAWTGDEAIDEFGQWLPENIEKNCSGTFHVTSLTKVIYDGDTLTFNKGTALEIVLERGTSYEQQIAVTATAVPFSASGDYPAVGLYFADRLWAGSSGNEPRSLYESRVRNLQNFSPYDLVEYSQDVKTEDDRTDHTAKTVEGSTTLTNVQGLESGMTYIGKYATGDYIPYGAQVTGVDLELGTLTLSLAALYDKDTISLSLSNWKDADVPEYEEEIQTTQQIGDANGGKHRLSTEEDETILWMAAAEDLVIGTASSEWVVSGQTTARSAKAKLFSRYGSARIKARMIGNAIFFVQTGGTAIRQFAGDSISEHADHILSPGIVQMEFIQAPNLAILAVLADGTLAHCLLSQDVPAWSLIQTRDGDLIESVAVIPGSGKDDVYISVLRDGVRYLEKLEENNDTTFSERRYLDCATYWSGSASLTISGLSRFNGVTVLAHYRTAEGLEITEEVTVAAGVVTLSQAATAALVGLPYTGRIETYRIEANGQDGSSEGIKKGIASVFLRLFRSAPFKVSYRQSLDTSETPPSDITTDITTPYTGPVEVTLAAPWGWDQSLIIESSDPVPLGIQTIVPKTELAGV